MTDDPWESPEGRAWRERANRELRPMIENSAATLSLWPTDGKPDAKFAVELGFSLALGKPLVILKPSGANVPATLARLAAAIIEYDRLDDPTIMDRVRQALDDQEDR